MNQKETWIRTDEAEDVAASVRHVLRCWAIVPEDEQAWKWVALALHAALQGACVSHLLTTAKPLGAVTNANAKEWMEYFDKSRLGTVARPKTRLMNLPELIKTARMGGSSGGGGDARGVKVSDSELQWLRRFHEEIRNQFVHFEPMGWSIEVSGLPGLSQLISRIIGEIFEIGWAFRHKNDAWKEAFAADLKRLGSLQICPTGD